MTVGRINSLITHGLGKDRDFEALEGLISTKMNEIFPLFVLEAPGARTGLSRQLGGDRHQDDLVTTTIVRISEEI